MADRQQDQNHQSNLKKADSKDDEKDPEASASRENIGNSTDNRQTAVSILSNSADGSVSNRMTSGGGNGGAPSASRLDVLTRGDADNVDRAAHSSCSAAVQSNTTATGSPASSQFGQAEDSDSEMAVVSESMAHASLSPSRATSHQRPEGAVVESVTGTVPQSGEKAAAAVAIATLVILPAKPAANEGKKKKKRSLPCMQPGQSSGRWTHAEHEAFLEGLKMHGREWKKVAKGIPTRTSAQVRSHAQKYFSKLSRDEQLMNHESQAYEAATAAAAAAAGSGASTASSATSTSQSPALPPGVQRNVERILANPEQAQRDVEETLRALRERYQQLQQRLRQHQQNSRQLPPSHRIEEEKEEEEADFRQEQQQQLEGANDADRQSRNGKRRRGEIIGDDCSTSSSTLASLGNEELIALSVLGATLPSAGGAQPPPPEAAQGPGLARQRSDSSADSTTTNHSNSSKSGKRKREDAG